MGPPQPDAGHWPRWIAESYHDLFGHRLAEPGELYTLAAVVLCHDRSPDPVFVYANMTAQRLWRRPWEQMIGWPSRLTAPPEERRQRAAALEASGAVRGYTGVRVSSTGERFRIIDAVVWPVANDRGDVVGQAASFRRWQLLPTADQQAGLVEG